MRHSKFLIRVILYSTIMIRLVIFEESVVKFQILLLAEIIAEVTFRSHFSDILNHSIDILNPSTELERSCLKYMKLNSRSP